MITPAEWQQVLDSAASEAGDHEEAGQNTGTCIMFQRVTGNGPGDSWCASFIAWLLLGVFGRSRWTVPLTGSCMVLWNALRRAGHALPGPRAQSLGFLVNSAGIPHHVFLVIRDPATARDEAQGDTAAGSFTTWEGNTDTTGSPDGTGVYQRTRGGPGDPGRYVYADISWI